MAGIAASSVEDAVMLLHDPRNSPNADEIAKAVGICAQVRESWDGLQLSLVLFNQSARPQVKFWCLQSVIEAIKSGHYAQLEESQRATIKTELVAWLREASNVAAESFVKTKFAFVLVMMFLTGDWPTFFHDMLSFVASCQHSADVFVRVLQVVDEEIACREAQEDLAIRARNTRIKDIFWDGNQLEVRLRSWREVGCG